MVKNKKILLSAYNIHQGGGAELLRGLINALILIHPKEVYMFVDKRTALPTLPNFIKIIPVRANLWQRLYTEFKMISLSKKYDILLCFGNLPPLFHSHTKTFIYVQNRYILCGNTINKISWKSYLRSYLERFWFKNKSKSKYHYVVQTDSMKQDLLKVLNFEPSVDVFPFHHNSFELKLNKEIFSQEILCQIRKKIFLYVSSADSHKNHRHLVEAWKLLANEGLYPKLVLTIGLNDSKALATWISDISMKNNLQIELRGHLSQKDLSELYSTCDALIFPSTFESLGLPLIEASKWKLSILAPELDYVRDIIDPTETFDPQSPRSIARAVKRYLQIPDKKQVIHRPEDFLNMMMGNN